MATYVRTHFPMKAKTYLKVIDREQRPVNATRRQVLKARLDAAFALMKSAKAKDDGEMWTRGLELAREVWKEED